MENIVGVNSISLDDFIDTIHVDSDDINNNVSKLKHYRVYLLNLQQNAVEEHIQTKIQKTISIIDNILNVAESNTISLEKKKLIITSIFDKIVFSLKKISNEITKMENFNARELRDLIENSYQPRVLQKLFKINARGIISNIIPEWRHIASDQSGWQHKTHNFRIDEHTFKAIDYLKEIPEFVNLSPHLKKIVCVTLFFHDIGKKGYSKTDPDKKTDPQHAVKSVDIAKSSLELLEYDSVNVELICRLIFFHETLGTLIFKKNSLDYDDLISEEIALLKNLKYPVYVSLLKIITLSDIYAVKRNGDFLNGNITIKRRFLQKAHYVTVQEVITKREAIDLECKKLLGGSVTKFVRDSEVEKVNGLLQKANFPYGHQKLLFHLLENWWQTLEYIGDSKYKSELVEHLVSLEKYILKFGLDGLIDLKKIVSGDIRVILPKIIKIAPLIEKYGMDRAVKMAEFRRSKMRDFSFVFVECFLPRIKILLANDQLYYLLYDLYTIVLNTKEVDLKHKIRMTNIIFDKIYNKEIVNFSQENLVDEVLKEYHFHIKGSSKGFLNSDSVDSRKYYIKWLGVELTDVEIKNILIGDLPMCYYHCTSIESLNLILAMENIVPLLLKKLYKQLDLIKNKPNYADEKMRILKEIANERRIDISKLKNSEAGSEVRSKYFKKEIKWLSFFGAPHPFNAKEDFYGLIHKYFTENSVIIELKPTLYKKILWGWMLLGGLFAKEEDLITFDKLTRDLVVKKPISVDYFTKIFTIADNMKLVSNMVGNLKIGVYDISSYSRIYTEEINELKSIIEHPNS